MIHNILLNEYDTIKINKHLVDAKIRNKNCEDVYKLLNDYKQHREDIVDTDVKQNLNKHNTELIQYNNNFLKNKENIINLANQYINTIHKNNNIIQTEFREDIKNYKEDIYKIVDNKDYNNIILEKQKELTNRYNKKYEDNLTNINNYENHINNSIAILDSNHKRIIKNHNDKLINKINNIKLKSTRNIINRDLQEKIYQPIYDTIARSINIMPVLREENNLFENVKENIENERSKIIRDFNEDFKILQESIQSRKKEYEEIKETRKEIMKKKIEYRVNKYLNLNKLNAHKKNTNISYKKKIYKSVVLW